MKIGLPQVKLCECLKSITHPTRFSILMLLEKGEMSVGQIENNLEGVNQSNLSQHLAALHSKGTVERRREGNMMFYSVTDKRIFKLLKLMKDIFCKEAK